MSWIVRRLVEPLVIGTSIFDTSCYVVNNGKTNQAVLEKRKQGLWFVWRLHTSLDGVVTLGGADSFKSFKAACSFVTENPGTWGLSKEPEQMSEFEVFDAIKRGMMTYAQFEAWSSNQRSEAFDRGTNAGDYF